MQRNLSRLGLLLWTSLLLAPLASAAETGHAASPVTVSEKESSAMVGRAPAVIRVLQLQDQNGSSGTTPLPSAARTLPIAPLQAITSAAARPPVAIAGAVLSSNYPTGPPTLS